MTATALLLLALTLVVAVVDWLAVHRGRRSVEYVAKPLTMVVLIAAALALEPSSQAARVLFVAALALSLVGDVFLMLPGADAGGLLFVGGLGAFLLGHIAYIVGMWVQGVSAGWFAIGLVIVAVAVALLGTRIIAGVRERDATMVGPVVAYIGVISLMVASAIGRRSIPAIAGASLFYASDAMIAWNRFITAYPWGPVGIMVTYHLGQVLLVTSLV